ncbi:hypothetical protein [Sphingomonas sp.]|uniref:hypothetical protein n=1 Tax=Sphingomonas sp. TaxID=28214 RepID=UPI0025DB5C93|nr:hypothetical protein [Sphingomonas sp.]
MTSNAPPFSSLENTVITLATGERGRGIPPTGWLAESVAGLRRWLNPDDRIRRLADPRLEALRVFVNATYRRGGARADDLAAFVAAGFSSTHIQRLAGNPASTL